MTPKKTDIDFLDALGAADSREALFGCLEDRLRRFGIGGFGYGYTAMRTDRGEAADRLELLFHHTYPKVWSEAVGDVNYIAQDPSTVLLFEGRRLVDWTALRPEAERIGAESLRLYDLAQDLGFRCGVGLRLSEDDLGRLRSGICLWFPDRSSTAEFHADWTRYRSEIEGILGLFDATVRDEKTPQLVGLSDRERDALSFLAAGYRSAEASWGMRISEKTFEKHVASAKVKLRARTRDHAIAKALVMRLIEP